MVKRISSKSIRLMAKSNTTIAPSEDLQEAAVDKDHYKAILEMFSNRNSINLITDRLQTMLNTTRTANQMKESDKT